MKKVFISQPMKGKTDKEILLERQRAISNVSLKLDCVDGIEIIDSFFQGAPSDAKPLWFLGKSIEMLSNADLAYFIKGWENSRGCVIEHMCAEQYGIVTIEEGSI